MSKSILQTPFWAEFKSHSGWHLQEISGVNVLIKPIKAGYSMAYIPEIADQNWPVWLPEFTAELKKIAKSQKLIFAKLEILESDENNSLKNLLTKNNYKKSFEFVQPEHRRIIPIDGTEEEILAQMKQKGRYNIKVARKHNIEIEIRNDPQNIEADADLAYSLIAMTGNRKNFGVRQKSYFADMLKTLYDNNAGALFIAKYQDKPVTALIISFYDGVASYFYGGSSTENKETMAPYLAHWVVIQEAKRRNCHTYDMLGAAPPDQPNHPYAGFARFKEQFGGSYISLLGSYDLIFNSIYYKIFCLAEKNRRRGVI